MSIASAIITKFKERVMGTKTGWFRVVAVFALLLIVGVWVFVFQHIANERMELRRNVTDHLGNIAVTLSHNISRTSGELDTLLKFMRAMRRSKAASVPWQDIVTEDYTLNRHTVQIAVIAKDGMMVTSTKMLYPPKPVDLSDREHYRVHRAAGMDQLFISKPVLGRASGKWSVQYTRPLFDEGGSFDGVIVVSLDPNKLTRIYGNLDLGSNGGVVIVGSDGIIRAGTGDYAAQLGKTFKDEALLRDLRADGSNYEAGLERHGQALKLVAKHTIEGYPLRVIVVADDVGGTGWLLKIQAYLLGAILFTALTVYATASAIRHHERENALLQEQNRVLVEKEVAEAASKTKGEFLAVMSHEIRTPLNGVLGALDLIKTEDLSPGASRHLEIASSSGEYLLSLIDDILVFSKLEEGRFKLEESPQSLRELFDELEALFRPLTEKAGNELIFDISEEMPDHVMCDAVRLRQVVLNLLSNANKFTSKGTITLRGAVLEQDAERSRLHLSVTDTGVGIPKEKQKIIFEKFQSLDASYSRRSDGTGLGLAICDKIIRAMGGEIRVESEFGKGSCFYFDLEFTIANQEAAEPLAESGNAESKLRRLKILLAEDNHTNAYITTQYLIADGHEVNRVETGQGAVTRATAEDFDLILMDISMPEKDGLTAAREIRQSDGPNRETPIIALTAHSVSGIQEKVEDSGMNAYLTKPIRRTRLLAVVRRFAGPTPVRMPADTNRQEPIIEIGGLTDFFNDRQIDEASPLMSIFITEMENRRQAMLTAISAKDVRAAGMTAHSVFGSASTVGAARLASLCKHLEREAETSESFDWTAAQTTVRAIDDTIAEFSTMISARSTAGQPNCAKSA